MNDIDKVTMNLKCEYDQVPCGNMGYDHIVRARIGDDPKDIVFFYFLHDVFRCAYNKSVTYDNIDQAIFETNEACV